MLLHLPQAAHVVSNNISTIEYGATEHNYTACTITGWGLTDGKHFNGVCTL